MTLYEHLVCSSADWSVVSTATYHYFNWNIIKISQENFDLKSSRKISEKCQIWRKKGFSRISLLAYFKKLQTGAFTVKLFTVVIINIVTVG
jgi:hypothetical protein